MSTFCFFYVMMIIIELSEKFMASIKDVASAANVSVKTVSRVLSGYPGVSDKTKVRVEAAMQKLEYFPSAAAQSLRGHEKGIVSVIAERLTTTPDSFDLIAGIQAECERQGKLLMIGESGGKPKAFERLVDDFRRQRSQAIIYATLFHREVKVTQSFTKCPLILVNCFEKKARFPTILPDDEAGAYALTESLIKLGHRHIAYLTLFEDMPATALRLKGYYDALTQHNIAVDEGLIQVGVCRNEEDEFAELSDTLKDLMARPNRPTAICCGNDKMAMRVYMLIRQMGYKIPQSISIVGYDDYKLISENLLPKLSTVSLPYFKMGEMAAKLALGVIDAKDTSQFSVSGELVLRQSHALPPTSQQIKT